MAECVTVITGASGGIGAELARIFAKHQHRLVLVSRNEQQLTLLANEIVDDGGKTPLVIACDLERQESVDQVAGRLTAAGLEVEYIVNNAGFGMFGTAATLSREAQLGMLDLNVRTLTDFSLRFTDHLIAHKGGILNVSSIAAFMPGPGMAVYYASKSYVLSFSEALHQELAASGVRVTALCPGPVSTGFQARAGFKAGLDSAALEVSARNVAQAGFDGLMAGKRVVLPGLGIKVLARVLRLVPRGFLAAAVARVQLRRT